MAEVVSGGDQRSLEVQIVRSPKFNILGFLEGFVLNFVCKFFFSPLPAVCCIYFSTYIFLTSLSHFLNFYYFLFPTVKEYFLTLSNKISSEISPTRCNNCVFILRNGFTLHVSGDNLTRHQEYICCIWPQVSRLT